MNILIIGASSGIGKQLAINLAAAEYRVWGTYNKHTCSDSRINYFHCDVLAEAYDWTSLPDIIDAFVYCPGSILLKPFMRITPQDYKSDYDLQVVGAIRCLQAIMPRLKLSTNASITFFSTIAVQSGFNFHSLVAASKGAIEGLSKALAAELAPHIRVNCIAPSITQTPLANQLLNTPEKIEANIMRHPLKKIGQPQDIAHLVEFLISDKSSWITGQIIHIDGGMSTIKL